MSQQIFCKDIQAHPIDCNCAGRAVPSGGQARRNRPHENPDCRREACRMHDDPLTTATAKIAVAVLVGGNVEAVAARHLAQLKIASDASRKAAERYAELMGVGLDRDGMPERPMLHYEAERERREYARSHGYFWISCPRCGQMFGGHEWRATIACSRDTDVGHGACCHGPGVDPDACARAHERDQE